MSEKISYLSVPRNNVSVSSWKSKMINNRRFEVNVRHTVSILKLNFITLCYIYLWNCNPPIGKNRKLS